MLFYHQKGILSMLRDAAEDYSSRKRECKEKVNRKRERKRKLGLRIILESTYLQWQFSYYIRIIARQSILIYIQVGYDLLQLYIRIDQRLFTQHLIYFVFPNSAQQT
jgi:hypothetical protein